MREIPLTYGYAALVDDEDFDRVMARGKWRVDKRLRTNYAVHGNGSKASLHRFLLDVTDPKVEVDHEDHNGLNCQRYNLRLTNKVGNGANRQKTMSPTSSQFKGVSWRKDRSQWRAGIRVAGRRKNLGSFDSEIEAAIAYYAAALQHFGEFTYL